MNQANDVKDDERGMFREETSKTGMTALFWAGFLLLIGYAYCATPFINTYLDDGSRASLRTVFLNALKSKELSAVYHGVVGLVSMGEEVETDKNQALCELVKNVNEKVLGEIHYAVGAAAALKNCAIPLTRTITQTVDAVMKQEKPSSQNIYEALDIGTKLKMSLSHKDFAKLLTSALKNDSGAKRIDAVCILEIITSSKYSKASLMDKANAEKFFAHVGDLVGEANEADGKFLYLDGGLSITALGINGIYELADKLDKSPNVKSDEAVKLANYLLSRRSVQMYRPACLLVVALRKFTNNNFQIPVVFSLASGMSVSDLSRPAKIRVSNVLGETVGALSVILDAAAHIPSKEVVIVQQSLKRVTEDATNTLYSVNLEKAVQRGFYNLVITAGSQDKRLVGTNGASLMVKVLTKVRIEDVSVAVYDRDLAKPTSTISVKEGSKVGNLLEADIHAKMEIKFVVKDARLGEAVTVHQAFVAFVHSITKQEIIFVATPSKDVYTFSVDFEKAAQDFEGLSGKYAVRLIIGDAAISYAYDWNLVDVNLKLPTLAAPKVRKSEQIIYKKLPEIKHAFRKAEKRPPALLSNAFTVLCVAPLFILLILWYRIGVNFGNMPRTPFVLLFHGGLTGIFVLYFVFWLRLNMFETLKYLSALGAFTFFAGNRLLRALASKRK